MNTQRLIEEFKTSPLSGAERVGVLGLSFVPEMEARYRRHRSTLKALSTQYGMALGLLLVIVMVLVDAIALGRSYTPVARAIIVWGIIPVMACASLLSFVPRLRPHLVVISAANICLLTVGFIAVWFVMQAASSGTSAPYTYETLIFIILFAFFFSGLSYAIASFVGLASVAGFLWTQWLAGLDTQALYYSGFFLIAANFLGILCLYVIEYAQRREFVAREMLHYLAERDPLTGAVNRRAMEFHLDKVWAQAARDATGVGVMLVDIDHFKQINDTQGHAHGDQRLIKFAGILDTIARRPWDLAARYGGDEFVVFLYDISEEDMPERTQGLLNAVRDSSEAFTVSIGSAHCVASPNIDIEALLRTADRRLYLAKEQGRDRAVMAG